MRCFDLKLLSMEGLCSVISRIGPFCTTKTRAFLRVSPVREGSLCEIGLEGYAALDSTALRGLLGVPGVYG